MVYRIPCSYGLAYIGETKRRLETRLKRVRQRLAAEAAKEREFQLQKDREAHRELKFQRGNLNSLVDW